MFKEPSTYTKHTLPTGTLAELLDGSYIATLQLISIYPFGDENILVEGLSITKEPDHIRVDLRDGRTTSFKVGSIACQSHHFRLICEYGRKVLNLTLDQDHPLYERLHEEI